MIKNLLLVEHGNFISKDFEIVPGIVSKTDGSVPIISANSTGAQITKLHYAFDTAYALFNDYNRTNKALWQILLSTVDEIFIRFLRHKYVRYGLTPTRTILDHLYAT